MSLVVGEINQIVVKRKTDIGYILADDLEEVFLHNNETNNQVLTDGMLVNAFLYVDTKGRLAATLASPHITISRPGFVKVIDVHPKIGVFIDNGTANDVLLSSDFLPYNKMQWPIVGDELYCVIKIKNQLVAKLVNKEGLMTIPDHELSLKDNVEAIVSKIGPEGINLLTLMGHKIFVHKTHMRETYRIGEKLNVRIIYVINSNFEYNGSLVPQKESLLFDDANDVLTFLIRNNYEMHLTSDSSAEEIYEIFQISKRAFKRALGTLYRERKINFVDGKTILLKKGGDQDE